MGLLCHQCTTKNITKEQNCMNKLSDPKPCEPSYGHCIVLSQYLVASKYIHQVMLKIHVKNVLLSALRCEWYSRMRFIFLKYPALHGILGIYFLQRNEKVRIFIVHRRQKETWRQKYAEIVSQFCICTGIQGIIFR